MDTGHYYYSRKFAIDTVIPEEEWAGLKTGLEQMPLEDVIGQRMEAAGFTDCICGCTYDIENCSAGCTEGTVTVETWKRLDEAEITALNESVTKMEQNPSMTNVLDHGEHVSFVPQADTFVLDTPLKLTEADLSGLSPDSGLEVK